jgi:hypothetical protein
MNLSSCSRCGLITSNATVTYQTTFSIIEILTKPNWGACNSFFKARLATACPKNHVKPADVENAAHKNEGILKSATFTELHLG